MVSFFDNKTKEIKIVNKYDKYTSKLIFSYNKESDTKTNSLFQFEFYKEEYQLLIYKKN